jgi:hypothetical protein
MDIIAEIRRHHLVENETISSLAATFKLSRPTIRKHLKTVEEPSYRRKHQPHPKLGPFHGQLCAWLEKECDLPRKQRRTAQRLFEYLQAEGYCGSYTAVQRYVKSWKRKRGGSPAVKQAFVPLSFPLGETCQFDWSHETVELGGVAQTVVADQMPTPKAAVMFGNDGPVGDHADAIGGQADGHHAIGPFRRHTVAVAVYADQA